MSSTSDIRDILQLGNAPTDIIQKRPKQPIEKRPG